MAAHGGSRVRRSGFNSTCPPSSPATFLTMSCAPASCPPLNTPSRHFYHSIPSIQKSLSPIEMKKSHSSFQMQLKMFSSLRNSLRLLMTFTLWTTKTLYVCYLLACVTFMCCDLPVCLLCHLCSGRSMRAGVEPSKLRSRVVQ